MVPPLRIEQLPRPGQVVRNLKGHAGHEVERVELDNERQDLGVQATKTREHSAVGGGYGLLAEAQSGEEAEHGVPESV
jgi:hypothetical protein